MKILRIIPMLLCLIFAFSPAAAQDAENMGWPVEERCVGEPTKPPEGWTFPGAILMNGHYGIHAVSANVPTPYVVAFIPSVPRYGAESVNSVFSPDQRWLAVPHATVFNGGLWVALSVYEITVYSTVTPHESYTIPWKASFDGYFYSPRWVDNEHLIYPSPDIEAVNNEYHPEETYIINPFTQQAEVYGKVKINPFLTYSFFSAPDWTRAVYDAQWFDNGWDATVDWGVYDPKNGDKLASLSLALKYPSIAWSPDSSQFVALVGEWEKNQQILLVDRDGKNPEIILKMVPDFVIDSGYATQVFQWTADSRYMVFHIGTKVLPRSYELYIADVERKQIFKTCMDASGGLVSSPDGKLLAMMGKGRKSPPVMVFDLDNWKLYTVAYHDGDVIGWRGG